MIVNDGRRDATGEEAALLLHPLIPRGEGGGGRVAHRGHRGHRTGRAAHAQPPGPPGTEPLSQQGGWGLLVEPLLWLVKSLGV